MGNAFDLYEYTAKDICSCGYARGSMGCDAEHGANLARWSSYCRLCDRAWIRRNERAGRRSLRRHMEMVHGKQSDDSTATSKDGSHGRAGASRGSETGGAGGEGEGTGTRPARGNDGPSPQGVADALEGTGRPAPLIGGVAPPAPDSDEPDVRGDGIESDRTNGGER